MLDSCAPRLVEAGSKRAGWWKTGEEVESEAAEAGLSRFEEAHVGERKSRRSEEGSATTPFSPFFLFPCETKRETVPTTGSRSVWCLSSPSEGYTTAPRKPAPLLMSGLKGI